MISGLAPWWLALVWVLVTALVTTATEPLASPANSPRSGQEEAIYTNQFVIQVKGGELAAREVAKRHGFVYLNHILGDYYHLEHRRLAKRSALSAHQDHRQATINSLNLSIQDEPQVLLLERQVLKRRVKRDFLDLGGLASPGAAHQYQRPGVRVGGGQPSTSRPSKPATTAHHYTRPANQPASGPQRRPPPEPLEAQQSRPTPLLVAPASSNRPPPPLSGHPPSPANHHHQNHQAVGNGTTLSTPTNVTHLHHPHHHYHAQRPRIDPHWPFNDPSWPLMWYLDGGAKNGFDLNVLAAWRMGYTGKGIVITILDDGLERNHPDLQANYDPMASFDINGDDADPMPRYDELDSNRHGTRCAGEVAAVPDNNICSIGIAYNSRVGGVRMLDGDVTDAVEARSLGLNNQHIHIYSASWGPDDNGRTVDGPGELATRAFIDGVTNGRQGLGSIFVFASGNGGREHDNCNCDGYTNSIWTLSISSATENGLVPWYIEACSSTLATTYSSGSYEERQITTTDIRGQCTNGHTGTSASAPLAAGICALVLESNPRLSWRDMQHIVVRTAKPANLIAKDWRQNGLGRNVSHAFGYGLMDAAAMIRLAKRWTTVSMQYTCEVKSPKLDETVKPHTPSNVKLMANCSNVRFLEHVQSRVTLTSTKRGELHIYLISPQGTRSTLLAQRPNDQAEQGFRNWPFMTVHSWGESPNGVWTLEVHNDGKQNRAMLKEWTLILYGTSDDPNRHLEGAGHPRTSPPPPPPPPMFPHQRPALTQTQPTPSRAKVATPLPPDFDVVSPPSSSTSTTTTSTSTTTTSTQTPSSSSTLAPTPTPTTTSSTLQSAITTPSPEEVAHGHPKPPLVLIDHNKIDGPIVVASEQQRVTLGNGKPADAPTTIITTTTTTTERPAHDNNHQNNHLDDNHMDGRQQSKDYRSSGSEGHSLKAASGAGGASPASGDAANQVTGAVESTTSPSSAATSTNSVAWLLTLATSSQVLMLNLIMMRRRPCSS